MFLQIAQVGLRFPKSLTFALRSLERWHVEPENSRRKRVEIQIWSIVLWQVETRNSTRAGGAQMMRWSRMSAIRNRPLHTQDEIPFQLHQIVFLEIQCIVLRFPCDSTWSLRSPWNFFSRSAFRETSNGTKLMPRSFGAKAAPFFETRQKNTVGKMHHIIISSKTFLKQNKISIKQAESNLSTR